MNLLTVFEPFSFW